MPNSSVAQSELFTGVQARMVASSQSASSAAGPAPSASAASKPAKVKLSPEEEKKLQSEKAAAAAAAKAAKAAKFGAPGSKNKEKEDKKKKEDESGAKSTVAAEKFVNKTPIGEKKDMNGPMDSGYNPDAVEAAWDAWWNKQGYFTPDSSIESGNQTKHIKEQKGEDYFEDDSKFVMVIPPPNVTGSLHLGHAITTAIEDCLTRWHRQSGKTALWVPGTDHAGIATQSVVERMLMKPEHGGLTRHDLGREKFLERVWEWKENYGGTICKQFRRLGASVDWSREAFTMDKNLTRAVKAGFVEFYKQGLIYRDTKLINWCSHLRTALSDLEVDHEEITGRKLIKIPGSDDKVEVGVMCYFRYKVKGGSDDDYLTIATTRLETMLGDTAVVVHPNDERYKKYIGKEVEHPFFPGNSRKMPIIADEYVDMEFGTGCMKVTPAHDHNDYKLGKKHKLEFINMLNDNGTICEKSCGSTKYSGMHRYKARRELEEDLKKLNLWVKKEDNAMKLGICSRSGDVIEPLLKPQWWMNCDHVAKQSVDAVESGELKIIPSFHEQTWFHWLKNIQQWCISRQLWWGHQIPAYKVIAPKSLVDSFAESTNGDGRWFVGSDMKEALANAKEELKKEGFKYSEKEINELKLEQDEDVLDTWFSSGLFPFSVMGWPEQTPDMKSFFPGQLLETGHDILFFWVARMVMMSLGLTGKLPFNTVYLHAMVRDKNGEKMSKSKGNVIDPLEVIDGCTLQSLHDKVKSGNLPEKEVKKAIEDQKTMFPTGIPSCGADALRFGLLAYTAQGRNVNLDLQRIVGYRHFCNKLWNATKFALSHLTSDDEKWSYIGSLKPTHQLKLEDKWILARLNHAAITTNECFKNYNFSDGVQTMYSFWLYELCDIYLELLKPRLAKSSEEESAEKKADKAAARDVLYTCLDQGLRLLHPMLPFVTEELYQRLPKSPSKFESICIAVYPKGVISWNNHFAENDMTRAMEVVSALRSMQSQLKILPKMNPKAFIIPSIIPSSSGTPSTDNQFSDDMVSIIKTLSRVGELTLIPSDSKPPQGVLISPVNANLNIALDAKELINLEDELKNLNKKIEQTKKIIADTIKKTEIPDYENKTPDNVKQLNKEKIETKRMELGELEKSKVFVEEAMK